MSAEERDPISFPPLSPSCLLSARRRLVGRRVVTVAEATSTNDLAFEALAREGEAASGAAFFAEEQTAGRGRLGRSWHARPGASILVSIALRLPAAPAAPALVAASAVAVREAIATGGEAPRIKWPNDLLVGGRKVCGILLEARASAGRADVALGIGVNVAGRPDLDGPPDLRSTATSLESAGSKLTRAALARRMLDRLDVRVSQALAGELADVEARFLEGLELAGRRVSVELHGGARSLGVLASFSCARGVAIRADGDLRWHAAESVAHVAAR